MIAITQWAGLATNASPYGLPPGATVEQVNLQCLSPGRVTPRNGLASTVLAGNSPIIQTFLYHHDGQATIVYQREDGTVAYQ
jgi:hypothetical protein